MTVEELKALALPVKQAYEDNNKQAGRRAWDVADYTAGFVGDVGDLSKLVMAKQGLRNIPDVDEKLAHELSDCLWSILVIADELGVDVEAEFKKNMLELHQRVLKED